MKALILVLLFNSCSMQANDNIKILFVADQLVDCIGVTHQKCMLIKEDPNENWNNFYGRIHGFEYEEGYLYKIKVKIEKIENPPQDASNLKYTLIEVLSKDKTKDKISLINNWEVVSMNGVDTMVKAPTIKFEQETNRVSGVSGCNNYFGTFKSHLETLSFSKMGMTRKMCPDMTVENAFVNNLKNTHRFKLEEELLFLFDKDGNEIISLKLIH